MLFLMKNLLLFIIRGHFIDNKFLKRNIMMLLKETTKSSINMKFGEKFIKFITINVKSLQMNYYEKNNEINYMTNWIIDK